MTVHVRKKSDSSYIKKITDDIYQAVEFNGNYPYQIRYKDKKNNIDEIVYDHSISIEAPAITAVIPFPFKVEVYDNSNNTLLATLVSGTDILHTHKYETRTTRPSAYKLKIISTEYPSAEYYSEITVTDTNSNTELYSKYANNMSHEFVFTPEWGTHIMLGAKIHDVYKKVNHAPFTIQYTGSEKERINIQVSCKYYNLYEASSDGPVLWDGSNIQGNPNAATPSITLPELYVFLDEYDGTTPDLTISTSTTSPYEYFGISAYSPGITIFNKNITHALKAKNSSGFVTGYVETVSMDFPDPSVGGSYISLIDDTIPFYAIRFSFNVHSRYYGTGSYAYYPYVYFESSYFDIQIDPSNISASGSTTRKFTVSGIKHHNSSVGSATAWYQDGSAFNPYGDVTASDHIASISGGTYSLAGDIYGQVLTGGSGNWTAEIYNNSPVNIKCQYYSKKTKENETTFDKTITVNKNSNSGNLTLRDQAWYDDRWFRVQAIGWYSTIGNFYTACYGAVKKIPDDNSKGYLY